MHDFLAFKWSRDFRVAFPALLAMLVAVALFSGCAITGNPVAEAKTIEQRAFASYGTFVVFEELGADIVENEDAPLSVRRAIQDADAKAKPVVDDMLAATLELQDIRRQVEAGETTADRLNVVSANLETWLARAGPLVRDLVEAVQGE